MATGAESEEPPRAPTPADLARIATALNEEQVRYVVVGAFAMAHHVATELEVGEMAGVSVRFLTAPALLRTKQTMREKDVPDRRYLERLIEAAREPR